MRLCTSLVKHLERNCGYFHLRSRGPPLPTSRNPKPPASSGYCQACTRSSSPSVLQIKKDYRMGGIAFDHKLHRQEHRD